MITSCAGNASAINEGRPVHRSEMRLVSCGGGLNQRWLIVRSALADGTIAAVSEMMAEVFLKAGKSDFLVLAFVAILGFARCPFEGEDDKRDDR